MVCSREGRLTRPSAICRLSGCIRLVLRLRVGYGSRSNGRGEQITQQTGRATNSFTRASTPNCLSVCSCEDARITSRICLSSKKEIDYPSCRRDAIEMSVPLCCTARPSIGSGVSYRWQLRNPSLHPCEESPPMSARKTLALFALPLFLGLLSLHLPSGPG